MANILDKIFADKKEEVASLRSRVPASELRDRAAEKPEPLPALSLLREGDRTRIIAEIKRRTPFKGELVERFDPLAIARAYAGHGAAAISVLTESRYFGGQIGFLDPIREQVTLPLLRKDFIFCEYQVLETRAYGADFFLLIATALDKNQIRDLMQQGQEMGMCALVEVHDERDLEKALYAGAALIGINNRDLTSGKTDLNISRRLLKVVRSLGDLTLVCESGIRGREEIEEFEREGIHAFLVGETLMRAPSISEKLGELLGNEKPAPG